MLLLFCFFCPFHIQSAADSPEIPRRTLRSPSRWLESVSQWNKAGHWLVELWMERGLGQWVQRLVGQLSAMRSRCQRLSKHTYSAAVATAAVALAWDSLPFAEQTCQFRVSKTYLRNTYCRAVLSQLLSFQKSYFSKRLGCFFIKWSDWKCALNSRSSISIPSKEIWVFLVS